MSATVHDLGEPQFETGGRLAARSVHRGAALAAGTGLLANGSVDLTVRHDEIHAPAGCQSALLA
ncbi:hypothetical protein [Streptomyces alanosinicus]|uniref:Uncharacterized protein n=1 Tax=Streptomyces alanosinicus TaxID=68171 RepID=A0A918YL40_9ACTN|nr:hypothetical protein [Streptomyces alanosinicus]GHE06746.1 hypothetical protein GCM10010339_49140 [Streptomyces alanosinicus]